MATVFSRALNDESIGNVFTITEKATTRAFSWFKEPVMTNLRVDFRFNLRFVQYGHSFHYPQSRVRAAGHPTCPLPIMDELGLERVFIQATGIFAPIIGR